MPRAAVVKKHLARIDAALVELLAALGNMDLRTANRFREAAGALAGTGNALFVALRPLNESRVQSHTRGEDRIKLLTRALRDAQGWVADANLPQDQKNVRVPGLSAFVTDMAYLWETYGGKRFTGSRHQPKKTSGSVAPSAFWFIVGILDAANVGVGRLLFIGPCSTK